MVEEVKGNNTREVVLRLFQAVVLFSIIFPIFWFTNVQSITLYLTTIKLHDSINEIVSDTKDIIEKLNISKSLQRAYTQRTVKAIPKERPQNCDECFSRNFQFLINNENICKSVNGSVEILILITSSPQNILARNAVRETWLTFSEKNKGNIRYAFLLGESVKFKEIEKENYLTKDIVLGNFKDTYNNLTLKTLMGFQWTVKHCKNAKFVMKTDDDMYVNIPSLIRAIKKNTHTLQSAVGGHCFAAGKPNRDRDRYASIRSYPQRAYPGFCSGTGYVTSLNVVIKIVNISVNVPFFHLEDVYVSLCIRQLGFRLHPLNGFMDEHRFDPCIYTNDNLVTVHHVSVTMLRHIWATPCTKREKNI
ncbi:B3GALT1 [Mytilus coruscus]|uniref:Hexosyltransferase n=1 Tax=Mytilus coruscus TaxID=42192 RepID=A0A6J8DBW9_MYTCO|nr:B3GALT1 [Mytilus coruscus]